MAKTMLPQALRLPSVPSSLLLVFLACLSLIHAHVVPHIQPNKVAPTRTSLEHKRATLTERASAKVTECLSGDQCTLGCCSSGGYCGFGPDFCAVDVCDASLSANGTCSHLAECDAGFYPGYFDELWGESEPITNLVRSMNTRANDVKVPSMQK